MISGQRSVVSGQCPVVNGQCSVVGVLIKVSNFVYIVKDRFAIARVNHGHMAWMNVVQRT